MLNDIELQEQIRKRLLDAVKQSGLSQTVICQKAGLSISMLTDYKNKGKMPSLITFARLCDILDISADEVFGLKQ